MTSMVPFFEKSRAWIELDMTALQHNISMLYAQLPKGCTLMPVVKANAYGHGSVLIAQELNRSGIRAFCVATVAEAVELREHGITGEILILGYTHPQQFDLLLQYNLTQTVINYEYAQMLNTIGQPIPVHIAVDTGMNRLGESWKHYDRILTIFQMHNLRVTGIFTHLCADDSMKSESQTFTQKQAAFFQSLMNQLHAHGYFPKAHSLDSYGLLNYSQFGGAYARVGIALYGVLSNYEDLSICPVPLYPVLSVKARVVLTKEIHAGENVGYGLAYTAKQDKRLALIAIGYADGVPRCLSCGNGDVLINGQSAPIVGQICMDQMTVDISNIPNVHSGDIAVILGKSGNREITAYDLAEKCGTITNELLSRFGSRLIRTLK